MPKGYPKNGINKGWIKKGQKLSDRTKKKISKNSARIWLGKKLSSEHIKKLSESHKGIKQSKKNSFKKNF